MFQHGQIRIAYIPAAMRASASSTYLDLLAAKSKNARLSDQKEYKLYKGDLKVDIPRGGSSCPLFVGRIGI